MLHSLLHIQEQRAEQSRIRAESRAESRAEQMQGQAIMQKSSPPSHIAPLYIVSLYVIPLYVIPLYIVPIHIALPLPPYCTLYTNLPPSTWPPHKKRALRYRVLRFLFPMLPSIRPARFIALFILPPPSRHYRLTSRLQSG